MANETTPQAVSQSLICGTWTSLGAQGPFTLVYAEGTFTNEDDVDMPLWTTTGVGMTGKTENSNYVWRRALGQAVVSGIVFALMTVLLRVVVDDEAFGDALPISVITGAVFALTFGGLTVLIQRARQKR